MLRKNDLTVLTAIFAMAWLGLFACSQKISGQKKSEQQTYGFTSLQLKVSTPRAGYLPLEPIPFTFTFTNPTDESVRGETTVSFNNGSTRIEVRRANKVKVFEQLSGILKNTPIPLHAVAPGETLAPQTGVLEYGLHQMFPTPGEYEVRFTKLGRVNDKVVSEPLRVVIEQPIGVDLSAYEYIKANIDLNRSGYPLSGGDGDLQESNRLLTAFIANFGTSRYAPYVLLNLAGIDLFGEKYDEAENKLETLKLEKDFLYLWKVEQYEQKVQEHKNRLEVEEFKRIHGLP